MNFRVPAGDDIATNQMFEYAAASVMAAHNGTLVSVDLNNDGDYVDAGELLDVVLDEGETLWLEGVPTGTHIVSSAPVQADLCAGDIGSNYEGNWYTLIPTNRWSDSYYSPVGTAVAGVETVILLYNPSGSAFNVTVTTSSGSSTISVPANGIAEFTMPLNQAASFESSGNSFFALGVVDYDEQVYDWGFTLQPESLLTTTLVVGWAPGSYVPATGLPDPAVNVSPVWVTALADTTLRVDYDGDPATGALTDVNGNRYDQDVAISRLQSVRLYDSSDNDQTGMRIYTTDGTILAGAWGEDPSVAPTAAPSLDLGTAVLSFASVKAQKSASLIGDFNGNGLLEPGEVLRYTLIVSNAGIVPLTSVVVEDDLDPNTTYVPDTTEIDGVPQPDNPNPTTDFPLDEGGLVIGQIPVGGSIIFTYEVAINDPFPVGVVDIQNQATVTSGIEAIVESEVSVVRQPALALVKTSSAGGSPVDPGDTLTYTLTVTNSGGSAQTGFTVNDVLPAGTSYVLQSTSVSGPTGRHVRDEFGTAAFGNNDGPHNWSANWVEVDGAGLGATTGNVLITGGTLSLDDNPDTGGQPSLARALSIPGCTTATFSFDYATLSGVDTTDAVVVEVSSTGTGGTYTVLETFNNITGATSGSRSYDIAAYASANTAVRFRVSANYASSNENFLVDDVEILATGCGNVTRDNIPGGANPDLANGAPPAIVTPADDYVLAPSQTLTVTYRVLVDNPLDINVVQIVNVALVTSSSVSDPASAVVADPVRQTGAVGDRVWLDSDGDGIQDVGEPGLAGVTVNLLNAASAVVATATTDANGVYLFDYLAAGSWRVQVDETTLPGGAGTLILAPGSANPAGPAVITVNEHFLGLDVGYRPAAGTGVIGDFVWSDASGDGVQDPGEVGLGGVTLELVSVSSGSVVDTTTTAASGLYLFAGVVPGQYFVRITAGVPAGFNPTVGPQSQGSLTSTPVTLAASGAITDVDFGLRNPNLFTVTNRVWLDIDADGVVDALTEIGIPGVTVDLRNASGSVVATITSDANGDFTFTGVANGNYTIAITDNADLLDGHAGTTPSAQARQLAVTVSGASVSGVHFGFNIPGQIGDLVYLDADGDGVHEPGEMGIGGVTVELRNGAGTVVLATTTTAADGSYLFANLAPSTYRVVVTDTGGALTGFSQTGDPDAALDDTGTAVLGVGTSELGLDFGYGDPSPAGISGTIFADVDEDAVQDGGESGIAGVTVELRNTSGVVVATTTTNASGDYSFPAVLAGDYLVAVADTTGVLNGYHLTSGLDEIAVTVAATNVTGIDFGYNVNPATASIGDYVSFDANRDGVQNASENGLGGVQVELWRDTNPDGVRGAGDTLVATATTLPDGSYRFSGLGAGNYFADPVEGTLPAGFAATTGTGGDSGIIALSDGEVVDDADFGYAPGGGSGVALGDLVFFDADADGFPDPGEVGIAGVQITVTGPGGFSQTVTTTATGHWLVTGITVAGTYNVTVNTATLPPDLDPVPTSFGSASVNFAVALTSDVLYADFGFRELTPGATRGSIGDTVYLDGDGNGAQDPGEAGLAFVTLALYQGGVPIATTSTNASGAYSFSGLLAGTYTVVVTDQSGVLAGLNLSSAANPVVVLGVGEDFDDEDWGYAPSGGTGTIGSLVWHDLDGSGDLDTGEPGIEGVTIQLWLDTDNNGAIQAGLDNLLRTAATDLSGVYLFTGVPFGNYLVHITDTAGVLAGLTKTFGTAGVDNHSQPDPYDVTLSATRAPSDFRADFGYVTAGTAYSISGFVFSDDNANGLFEPPLEVGVSGATLFLFRDMNANGVLDAPDQMFGTTLSAAGGSYSFGNLPGNSRWIVAANTTGTSLSGATQTTQLLTGGVEPVQIVSASQPNRNFGFTRPPTLALVTRFQAFDRSGAVVVEWETASEIGTLGFYVFRWDGDAGSWHQVNDLMLPSEPGASRGAVYRLLDDGASSAQALRYLLVEIEVGGVERAYGPWDVIADGEAPALPGEFSVSPRPMSGFEAGRNAAARAEAAQTVILPVPGTVVASRVKVTQSGVHFVSAARLASDLGLSLADVAGRIQSGELRIDNLGTSVDWWSTDGSGLYFYGEETADLFSRFNPYFVSARTGSQAASTPGASPAPQVGTGFLATERYEQNVFAGTAAARNPNSDYWFWAAFSADHPVIGTRSFDFTPPDLIATAEARLEIELFGATTTIGSPDHAIVARINGTEVGTESWEGGGARSLAFDFPGGILQPGVNTLEIEADLPPGVAFSVIYLDSFAVTYQRELRARSDRLRLRADDNAVVTVAGFSSPDILVLDVTTPKRPRLVSGVTVDDADGYRAAFVPAGPSHEYLVATRATTTSPATAPSIWSEILGPSTGGDYVVIAPDHLVEAAEALAALREQEGMSTLVLPLSLVYDNYAYGLEGPRGIQSFLRTALSQWRRKPQFVLLLGKGSFDYKDYLGTGTNLLPPLMVATPLGLYASDTSYADVAGNDGVPEVAIGRLPALTSQEVYDYIDKLVVYESGAAAAGDDQVAMLADDTDEAGSFLADSESVINMIPDTYGVSRIYLDETTLAEARGDLLATFDQGARAVNYIGHGGTDRLAAEGLLTTGDTLTLTSSGRLPIVSSLTCAVGRFEYPGLTSLAEALTLGQDRGAIAVFAPSGLSFGDAARTLNQAYINRLFDPEAERLGTAVRSALSDYGSSGDYPDMIRIYNLFGDPALRLPGVPPPPDPGLFSDGFESGDLSAWSGSTP